MKKVIIRIAYYFRAPNDFTQLIECILSIFILMKYDVNCYVYTNK